MPALSRRLLAALGGLMTGLGVDQYEGPDSRPGLLVAGLGLGLLVAALVRD